MLVGSSHRKRGLATQYTISPYCPHHLGSVIQINCERRSPRGKRPGVSPRLTRLRDGGQRSRPIGRRLRFGPSGQDTHQPMPISPLKNGRPLECSGPCFLPLPVVSSALLRTGGLYLDKGTWGRGGGVSLSARPWNASLVSPASSSTAAA